MELVRQKGIKDFTQKNKSLIIKKLKYMWLRLLKTQQNNYPNED